MFDWMPPGPRSVSDYFEDAFTGPVPPIAGAESQPLDAPSFADTGHRLGDRGRGIAGRGLGEPIAPVTSPASWRAARANARGYTMRLGNHRPTPSSPSSDGAAPADRAVSPYLFSAIDSIGEGSQTRGEDRSRTSPWSSARPSGPRRPFVGGDRQRRGPSPVLSQYVDHLPATFGAHRRSRALPSPAPHGGATALASLRPEYHGETRDASSFRGPAQSFQHLSDSLHNGARVDAVRTRYFDRQEQARSEISVEDGLLKTSTGEALDTQAATGYGTFQGTGAGKHIFTLTPQGQVRATDPWEGRQFNTLSPGQNDPRAPVAFDLVNHSSLVAGGQVAGAGELTAEEGRLQQISDGSGHYRPGGTQMRQSLEHFQQQGVDTHDVAMRFVPKADGERPLIASSRELEAEPDAEHAEARMRGRRALLARELADAVGQREARLAPAPVPAPPVQYAEIPNLRGGRPIPPRRENDFRNRGSQYVVDVPPRDDDRLS